MRTYEEYELILTLSEQGFNKLQIAKKTGLPRTTIRDSIKKFGTLANVHEEYRNRVSWRSRLEDAEYRRNYTYLFGLYLGDGYISKGRSTYRMRIVQDSKYPNLIEQIKTALQGVVPDNVVNATKHPVENKYIISAYSSDWAEIFPQHGEGEKHTRKIALEDWQQVIVDEFPIEFLRGLYHSDGSRTVVRDKKTGKIISTRYQFAQKSLDIRKLFTDTLEKLGIAWTQQHRNTTVYRKVHTAYLDQVLGPKS